MKSWSYRTAYRLIKCLGKKKGHFSKVALINVAVVHRVSLFDSRNMFVSKYGVAEFLCLLHVRQRLSDDSEPFVAYLLVPASLSLTASAAS